MKHIIFILFISLMPVSIMSAQDIEEKEQDLALPEDTVTHVTSVTTEEDVKNKKDVQLLKAIDVLNQMTNGQSVAIQ